MSRFIHILRQQAPYIITIASAISATLTLLFMPQPSPQHALYYYISGLLIVGLSVFTAYRMKTHNIPTISLMNMVMFCILLNAMFGYMYYLGVIPYHTASMLGVFLMFASIAWITTHGTILAFKLFFRAPTPTWGRPA
jgi:hypothetical protein